MAAAPAGYGIGASKESHSWRNQHEEPAPLHSDWPPCQSYILLPTFVALLPWHQSAGVRRTCFAL